MPLSADRRTRRAFTLVEVLVVVVILGIAGAIVAPAIIRPGTLGVQAAARMVIADILIAQNDAIASQTTRRVVFEPAFNRYRLTDNGGTTLNIGLRAGGTGTANYVIDFAGDNRFAGVTLQNINIGGTQILEFDPLGAPTNGGSLDLVAGGTTYRIVISPFTGRVTVSPVTPP